MQLTAANGVGRVSRRRNPTFDPRVGGCSKSDYAALIRPTCLEIHLASRQRVSGTTPHRTKGGGVCSLSRRQVGNGGGMGMDKERAGEAAALENHRERAGEAAAIENHRTRR